MREIDSSQISEALSELIVKTSTSLGDDILTALHKAYEAEVSPAGRDILLSLLENARIAGEKKIPLCQDTGTAIVFAEAGQDVHINGNLVDAINLGVRQGYEQAYLRKSIVSQPFSERANTQDNTPAVIHTEIVPGDRLKLSFMAKGSGAENMSRLFMLKPGVGREGVIEAVLETVENAGGSPCPPIIIGLGVGATAEKAMFMAKKALLRPLGVPSPVAEVAALEAEVLKRVNGLGIGPLGLGGRVTALGVMAEVAPTHIASLPVAVNLQCHSARHGEVVL
ncbi:fumarate hydratase [Dehalococcoides mccartyi]|uniref:fumarate hydratase n=1 Tax=Dehalococcoides mccartyi TaxID=61435 RepID=UPI0003C85AE1|nr:fumarate hydratase [Dehalococcoides mccartyi]AHB13161.1 fumarate hydratase subunit alpha [Dehalococcoides mccartyi GY50]